MKLSLRPVTIQGRLLAIFIVAAALPLAVVSLISYHNSVESVEKMVGNRTSKIAVSVGTEVSEKLRARLEADRILLANDEVQKYLETLPAGDPEVSFAARANLRTYTGDLFQQGGYGQYYSEMILADANGVPIFRQGRARDLDDTTPLGIPGFPSTPGTPSPPTRDLSKPTSDDTLTVILPKLDEIPIPWETSKVKRLTQDVKEQVHRQRKIEIQTDGSGVHQRTRITDEETGEDLNIDLSGATRMLGDWFKERLTRDYPGSDASPDVRFALLMDSYKKQYTEDDRLAARTGARLAADQNLIYLHHETGEKVEAVRLIRPVFSMSEPSRRLGVMILDLRPDYLFPSDLSGERFGSKGEVLIVDLNSTNKGEILCHSEPSYVGQNLNIVSHELARRVEKTGGEVKATGWFPVKDDKGRKLAAMYPVESNSNWVVIATAFPREFEAEAREAGLLNLAVASAAVLLALGFLLVSSRKISQSVHIVTEGAREIAAGNLNHTIRVKTRDEIQTLAETFNAMTISLRENIALRENAATELEALNRTLEDRVAVRTKELQALNEALGRANQELQELDRLKSNFLATVSHEFKTPLTSITAFSEILSDEMQERAAPPEVLRFLNIINNESGRLGRLIRNLLDLSRIEARRMRWEHSTFRVKDVVDASMDGLLPVFSEKNIQVHHSIECPEARISADRDRIQQVITNLIENAVKFSNKGSRIWVDCHESNHGRNGKRYLEFSVKDEGPGIPPSQLVRIFERFTQVDSTDTRGTGGSGLGLAISKEIVEHHGGSIWVDSEEGIGATFHFTIPRLGEEAQ